MTADQSRSPQDPQAVLLAGRLDDPRQHQLPECLVTLGRAVKPDHLTRPAQRVPQVPRPRGGDHPAGRPRPGCVQSEVQLAWPAAIRCRAAALSSSASASPYADPMCSISRALRREKYTIYTTVAADAVLTVRTYGTATVQERPG